MVLALTDDARKQAVASITRFCLEEIEAVADAEAFLRDRLADMDATLHEPEFVYWPKDASVRRKP